MILRTTLIPATGFTSSYKKRFKPKERWGVEVFKDSALIAPDFLEGLKLLDQGVRDQNGSFFITELTRTWKRQAAARRLFELKIKKAFVAKPGGSFHNGGRAVDISVQELGFEGIPKEEWLQLLWDIAKPLGFKPIIRIPDIKASEAWHFDFPGRDWELAYSKLTYPEIAKCVILDAGLWNSSVDEKKRERMYIQAQCIRLGHFEIGKVDGIIGRKTETVLDKLAIRGYDQKTVAEILTQRVI